MVSYREYLSHPTQDFKNPPLESGSGEEARKLGRLLADPDVDWDAMIKAIQGRPTLEEKQRGRKASRQHSIRLTQAMEEYVNQAMDREGVEGISEYVRLLISKDATAHSQQKKTLTVNHS